MCGAVAGSEDTDSCDAVSDLKELGLVGGWVTTER